MKVYFVQDGESTFNALGIHQHREVSLSEAGKKQVSFVAKRFTAIPIDVIIASPFLRTRQTADAIHTVVQKEIIYTELLNESKRPTEFEKKSTTDPQVLAIKQSIQSHYSNKYWHHSDEENFFDSRKRAEAFIAYLEDVKEENVLVVTHGMILRMIVASMFFEKPLTPDMFLQFERFFKTKNTGITICECGEDGRWQLLSWNDCTHLG